MTFVPLVTETPGDVAMSFVVIVSGAPAPMALARIRLSSSALWVFFASVAAPVIPAMFGIAMAAIIAMTAMTTRSSTKLNAELIFAFSDVVCVFITMTS